MGVPGGKGWGASVGPRRPCASQAYSMTRGETNPQRWVVCRVSEDTTVVLRKWVCRGPGCRR